VEPAQDTRDKTRVAKRAKLISLPITVLISISFPLFCDIGDDWLLTDADGEISQGAEQDHDCG
jgi:hypothetical protein